MSWSGNKCIHHNIVAKTAAHHKQVENFVGAEEAVLLVKEWKLHGIDNATDGIDDACRGSAAMIFPKASTQTQPMAM